MTAAPAGAKTAIDVTWNDQRNICTFGRMHRRFNDLVGEIKRKTDDIEKMNDAGDEILIADEIKHVFGESFIAVDSDTAEKYLASKKAVLEGELALLKKEQSELEQGMKGLKAQLYAKFGNQIYLEDE